MNMDRIKEDLGLVGTTLSLHVVDTVLARPAAGLAITVSGSTGITVSGRTDAEGRARVPGNVPGGPTTLAFATGPWYAAQQRDTCYPEIQVQITVTTGEHHHIGLLLGPFAYTVYRDGVAT